MLITSIIHLVTLAIPSVTYQAPLTLPSYEVLLILQVETGFQATRFARQALSGNTSTGLGFRAYIGFRATVFYGIWGLGLRFSRQARNGRSCTKSQPLNPNPCGVIQPSVIWFQRCSCKARLFGRRIAWRDPRVTNELGTVLTKVCDGCMMGLLKGYGL